MLFFVVYLALVEGKLIFNRKRVERDRVQDGGERERNGGEEMDGHRERKRVAKREREGGEDSKK